MEILVQTKEAKSGFYPTPMPLARELLSDIDWDMISTVLEPSAGKGDLIRAIAQIYSEYHSRSNRCAIPVDCIEFDPYLRSILATHVNLDCDILHRAVMVIFTNRLRVQKGSRLSKQGRQLTNHEKMRYGKTATLRFVAGSREPIYPIGYVQHKNPMAKKGSVNPYSTEGRKGIHDNLRVNTALMWTMMKQPLEGRSVEYADNRISLFSAQWGKCAITGKEFVSLDSIHCHHITPRSKGGTDRYHNLVLVLLPVHKLIHATQKSTIDHYLKVLNLNKTQLAKVNEYREKAGNAKI